MTNFHVTHEICVAAYDLIRACPPFKSWKLPPGEEVEFHIISSTTHSADYMFLKSKNVHRIRINEKWTGTLWKLILNLMHEMCHMKHEVDCPNDQAHHGKRFQKLAQTVCKIHILDIKSF